VASRAGTVFAEGLTREAAEKTGLVDHCATAYVSEDDIIGFVDFETQLYLILVANTRWRIE
jgi:hypothetical protein